MKTNQPPASILVTDDETNIRLMVRTALESDGYAVTEAADGRAALAAIERDRPDLMVLDLNMPALDGMAVLEQMKHIAGRRPRVVVLTAYGSIPAAVRAARLGAVDFIEKPVLPADLRVTVRGALEVPPVEQVGSSDLYEAALDRARRALRMVELDDAELLLADAAARKDRRAAEYFNLLGVLFESKHRARMARRCFEKATDADNEYRPGVNNLRRLAQKADLPVDLGDEDDVWMARLPRRA